MGDWGRAIGAVIGGALVAVSMVSLVQTFVVPRGRRDRPVMWSAKAANLVVTLVASAFSGYERKDRIFAWWGPLNLLGLLALYLLLFHVGWSLLLWPTLDGGSFLRAAREAGSSLYTLGFASTEGLGPTALDFMAAASGLLTVALLIAYLPVLYAAFSRRETLVTMLQSRAGAPAWGPEILARHQSVDIVDNLPQLYADWEEWAAEVAESHTNYPVLVGFRSPNPLRSWIIGLLAVLDAAALHHAVQGDEAAPSEARLCLRMGFTCLRDIADGLGIAYDPDPDPDGPLQLPYDSFLEGIARMESVGFPMQRSTDEAWRHFRGWRVNYESLAYSIADLVIAPPAPWSGPRSKLQGIQVQIQRPVDRRPGGDVRHIEVPRLDG